MRPHFPLSFPPYALKKRHHGGFGPGPCAFSRALEKFRSVPD